MLFVLGHSALIERMLAGQVGEDRAVQPSVDDDGHYSDIHVGAVTSVEEHDHYIDIDGASADIGETDQPSTEDPDGGDQAARLRNYEGLDPSVIPVLRQPQAPHDYARLVDREAATSAQQTTEVIEMHGRP